MSGVTLRIWLLNRPDMIKWFSSDLLAIEDPSRLDSDATVNVLGSSWQPNQDKLKFVVDNFLLSIEILGFANASKEAYVAVVYLHIV